MIKRLIYKNLTENLSSGKILILTGSRQVGKTTLLKDIIANYKGKTEYINCDEPDYRSLLSDQTSTSLRNILGKDKLVLMDEAQRVHNIGLTLKLIHDNFNDIKLIVTGSSAIDIDSSIKESLAGRHFSYKMYPLSLKELVNYNGLLTENRLLDQRLVFGFYPDVINHPDQAKQILENLIDSYLFKDIFEYKNIRKPEILKKLLILLSYQISSEISYNELATQLGIDNETVETYIDLLEKSYVIFRLSSFSRNMRNELKKKKKIYFYDNGIRNAIIRNFKPLDLRNDSGALFENFVISEKIKYNSYNNIYSDLYFWRNSYQQEIDLIEDKDGILYAYEIKFNPGRKVKLPKSFKDNYVDSEFKIINKENIFEFIQ